MILESLTAFLVGFLLGLFVGYRAFRRYGGKGGDAYVKGEGSVAVGSSGGNVAVTDDLKCPACGRAWWKI
jgi:hypothetical protein